jgi:tetratricopeptide (TPR) repeat protein
VLKQASKFRERFRSSQEFSIDPESDGEISEVLQGVCALIAEECMSRPGAVLEEASSLRTYLSRLTWTGDVLEEREGLLCSLAFLAWRASRVLRWTETAQRWEAEYASVFRQSLMWEVIESVCASDDALGLTLASSDPERIFQITLFLQDQREVIPERTLATAEAFYRLLSECELSLDTRPFFLANAALLAGGSLRQVGRPRSVERWIELAETHLKDDPDPAPSLARVSFLRLAALHEQSRNELVAQSASALDQTFALLGMEEDRVKCRILWAASLKMLGRFEEALDVLEPPRAWRPRIRSGLFGWVLLQSGDLHQLCGLHSLALKELAEAELLLREGRQVTGLADVHSMISCIYRSLGMLREALHLLKSSCHEHARLGLKSLEAHNRMLIAETYLAMGRPHDAETEIRAAIPVFEDEGMVADAVVAVSLLREAIRRQKLEPRPVVDIRDRFRPKK